MPYMGISIAVAATAALATPLGHGPNEAVPQRLCAESSGRFLFAAGTDSDGLTAYPIDQRDRALQSMANAGGGSTSRSNNALATAQKAGQWKLGRRSSSPDTRRRQADLTVALEQRGFDSLWGAESWSRR
jgi:hypothetical protein